MKGVGRIYQQTFIDTYSRVAFAKLYTEKTAITAAHMLNEVVVPWYEQQSVSLRRILTDRGTEYRGRLEEHAYQLFLAIENIDHSKTKARSPQTNGITERFHKTMKNEFYDITFRKKIYHSVEELQQDANEWLAKYNEFRPHSGRYCYGKTPMQTFLEGKATAQEKMLENNYEVQDNELELAQQDNSSTEILSHQTSITPSEALKTAHDNQGVKLVETREKLNLND